MDYEKLIAEVKDGIDNYSFDDSEYKKLYDSAYSNLEQVYKAQGEALDQSYYNQRRRAAGENALGTKNMAEQLASRGLARSGESADLLINQGVSLNSSLSNLAESNIAAKAYLAESYGDKRAELDRALAQEIGEATRAEKEALYERLSHLENLNAEQEARDIEYKKWQEELELDRYALDSENSKWKAELDFDRYVQDSENAELQEKLAAEEEKWRAQLAADEEKWRAQLSNESAMQQAKLEAEEEKWRAQLFNDRFMLAGQLKANEEKWRAELAADAQEWKWDLFYNAFKDNSNASGDTTADGTEPEVDAEGLDPDIAVQTMANNIALRYTSTEDGITEFSQDDVYKEFARLISTSNLNKDYAEQVLAALRSRGFNKEFSIDLALKDYVREGFAIYNSIFDSSYADMLSDGTAVDDAYTSATLAAEEAVEDYIDEQGLDNDTKRQVLNMYGLN